MKRTRVDRSGCALRRHHRFDSITDHVEHGARLGEHRHVAALQLDGRCAPALGAESFQLRMDCAILGAHDVPAWLRPPGDAVKLLAEEVSGWREVGRIDDALLFGRQIAGKARNASARLQPDAAVGSINVFEHVRRGELGLYALRRFGLIRAQGCNIDQSSDAGVHGGVRVVGSSIGVADKNYRPADPPECANGRVDVAFQRVEAVLRGHYLVTLGPQRRDQLLEAGTIGPDSVREDDTWFGHSYIP